MNEPMNKLACVSSIGRPLASPTGVSALLAVAVLTFGACNLDSYRLGGDKMLKDKKGKSRISMEDFAVALVDEAENGNYVGQRFSVAW